MSVGTCTDGTWGVALGLQLGGWHELHLVALDIVQEVYDAPWVVVRLTQHYSRMQTRYDIRILRIARRRSGKGYFWAAARDVEEDAPLPRGRRGNRGRDLTAITAERALPKVLDHMWAPACAELKRHGFSGDLCLEAITSHAPRPREALEFLASLRVTHPKATSTHAAALEMFRSGALDINKAPRGWQATLMDLVDGGSDVE